MIICNCRGGRGLPPVHKTNKIYIINKGMIEVMVSKELSEAAVEVNEILKYTSPELVAKIPQKFMDFLNEISSKTYTFDYDKTKSLEEQELKPKTQGLLALIYKDYLCDDKEKQEYMDKVAKVLYDIEQEKKEKYNTDNLFENKAKPKEEQKNSTQNNLPMEKEEEGLFKRIFLFFKKVFFK